MTCIAWDTQIIATDSRHTWGDLVIDDRADKLIEYEPGKFIALTGRVDYVAVIREWYERGMDRSEYPTLPGEDIVHALRWDGRRMWMSTHGGNCLGVEEPVAGKIAIGSGGDYAIGAMAHGADAIQAVRAAIKCCNSCGGRVQWRTLRKKKGRA